MRRMQSDTSFSKPKTAVYSCAGRLDYRTLFWIFFIGCFIGVVVETVWCILTLHTVESRAGLVWGPFNAVYGFGALLMTLVLHKLGTKKDVWVFLGCTLIGAGFEYMCSVFQEYCLGTVSWDYSGSPTGFVNGRIDLLFSFSWGILGLLWLKFIFPFLKKWIEKIPHKLEWPLTVGLSVFMALNMAVSFCAVYRQSQRREGAAPGNAFEEYLDRRYPDSVLDVIYANARIVQK